MPAEDACIGCLYNVAAEQKARTTYDNILRMVDDPDVIDPIRYLRQREINHFQRFGETKREVSSESYHRRMYEIEISRPKRICQVYHIDKSIY